jgi:hypothetical protein
MPRRFVILEHDHPFLHWDLLLEEECSARTLRLLRKPCLGEPMAAEPLPDHRLMYLDYEGVVSGDRGSVKRFLSGTYQPIPDPPDVLAFALLDNSFAKSVRMRALEDGRLFVSFA